MTPSAPANTKSVPFTVARNIGQLASWRASPPAPCELNHERSSNGSHLGSRGLIRANSASQTTSDSVRKDPPPSQPCFSSPISPHMRKPPTPLPGCQSSPVARDHSRATLRNPTSPVLRHYRWRMCAFPGRHPPGTRKDATGGHYGGQAQSVSQVAQVRGQVKSSHVSPQVAGHVFGQVSQQVGPSVPPPATSSARDSESST